MAKLSIESRGAMAALAVPMLMASLGSSVANAVLPSIAQALDAPFRSVQWILLAYLLAVTTLVIGAGRLSDSVGRKRLLIAGIAIGTLASVGCALAPSLPLLVLARAAQGAGAAVMMSLSLASVGQTLPKEKFGAAMGLLGTMSAAGTALGPSLGGMLAGAFGWRSIFLLLIPLGAAGITLAVRYLPSGAGDGSKAAGFDLRGTLLLGGALAAYSLSVTLERGKFGVLSAGCLLISAIAAVLFALSQRRASPPLIDLGLLRRPQVRSGLVTSLVVSTVLMATLVVGPFYLSRALHLAPSAVGLAMAVGPVLVAASGIPAGRLADRFGASPVSVWGLTAVGVGCVAFTMLSGIVGYCIAVAVVALGYASFQTANNAGVMAEGVEAQRGLLSGMLNLSRNLGSITGASLMGFVFSLGSGVTDVSVAAPEAVAQGFRLTFALGAALIGLAGALGRWGRRKGGGGRRLDGQVLAHVGAE